MPNVNKMVDYKEKEGNYGHSGILSLNNQFFGFKL